MGSILEELLNMLNCYVISMVVKHWLKQCKQPHQNMHHEMLLVLENFYLKRTKNNRMEEFSKNQFMEIITGIHFQVRPLLPDKRFVHVIKTSILDLEAEIERLAAGLAGLGLSPGSKIAFYMETRKEWFTMAHAAWRAGLTVVTVYASLGDEAVIDALTESEATVLFSSAPLLEKTGAKVRKAFKIDVSKFMCLENLPEKL